MVYHIGLVERVYPSSGGDVIAAEQSTEARVWMWDENLMILKVHPSIADKIREGDYVLADYYPSAENTPNLRRIITKILRGKAGEETWRKFKEYHKNKSRPTTTTQVPYG
jgi:hypothetical protein